MKHTALYLRVSTRSTGGRKDTRSRSAGRKTGSVLPDEKGSPASVSMWTAVFRLKPEHGRPLPSWWRKSAPARSSASLSTSLAA